jgi:hypothetical protein
MPSNNIDNFPRRWVTELTDAALMLSSINEFGSGGGVVFPGGHFVALTEQMEISPDGRRDRFSRQGAVGPTSGFSASSESVLSFRPPGIYHTGVSRSAAAEAVDLCLRLRPIPLDGC